MGKDKYGSYLVLDEVHIVETTGKPWRKRSDWSTSEGRLLDTPHMGQVHFAISMKCAQKTLDGRTGV